MKMYSLALGGLTLAAAVLAMPSHATAQAACDAAWNSATAYTGGQTASYSGINYTANWWTQGQVPSSNNGGPGSGQPWTSNGACTTSGSGSGSGSGGGTGTGSGGGTGTGSGGGTTTSGSTAHLFAPYVDMSITVDENIASTQQAAGFKAVTLAFIDTTNGCSAGWGGLGGSLPTDNFANGTTVLSAVQQMQANGVQVIISFGGANGQEPAVGCAAANASASQLQALYQGVISRYNVKLLDFDIEGGEETNTAANTLRAQALKALKAANPGLVVSYTLPVLPSGLDNNGLAIVQNAQSSGLALDVVNIMAMDYGSSVAAGGMATDAISAAQGTYQQVQGTGETSTTIGITPMVGQNDSGGEVFSLNDAQTVLNFANSNSFISRLSMWSVARDNGSCPGQTWASPSCSGLTQNSYQFISNFNAY